MSTLPSITAAQKRTITRLSKRAILTETDQYAVWDALCDALGRERGSDAAEADLSEQQAERYIERLQQMAAEERCPGPCRERGVRHTAIFRDDASLASDGLSSVPACTLS